MAAPPTDGTRMPALQSSSDIVAPTLPGAFGPLLWSRLIPHLVGATVFAITVSLVVQVIGASVLLPRPSHVPTAAVALSAFSLASALAVLCVVGWARSSTVAAWCIPAALSSAAQTWTLNGTSFYLFGTGGDQYFRMQYLGRYAASPWLADPNYADLPPFYPAPWFWLGGRLADVFGVPAWQFYKPYAIATMAVAASLAVVLWGMVESRQRAAALGGVTAVVGLSIGVYEPYSWVLMACVPPLAVVAFEALQGSSLRHRTWSVPMGLFLGACAVTYTLLAIYLAGTLVLMALVVVCMHRRHTEPAYRCGVWVGIVGVVALFVALPLWLPYLIRASQVPSAGNGAARYFPDVAAALPTPMFDVSPLGVLCLAGVAWLALASTWSVIARALAVLVAGCYLWHLLSTAVLVLHTTLLAFHIDVVLALGLACAGALGVADFVSRAGTAGLRPLVAVLAVLAVVSVVQQPDATNQALVDGAFTSYDDRGRTASGNSAPSDPGAWNGQVLGALDELLARPAQDVVLLTSQWSLFDFRPYRGFQTSIQEYANPLGLFPARRDEIRFWSAAADSRDLSNRLDRSAFVPPTAFVLVREQDGLHLTVSDNQFPRSVPDRYTDVVFPDRLFSGPEFVRRDVGPLTILIRRRTP